MKKIIKRITTVIIATVMATGMIVSASAEETTDYITAHMSNGDTIILLPEESDEINDMARGTAIPSEEWDFNEDGAYHANLDEVASTTWLYTNYFFYCSDDGEIYVKYRVKRNSNSYIKMRISVYDLTTDTSYNAFLTDYLPISSYLTNQMYFSGLNSSHQYAIRFIVNWEIDPSTISGDALISDEYITETVPTD